MKRLTLLVVIIVCLSISFTVLSGCGKKDVKKEEVEQVEVQEEAATDSTAVDTTAVVDEEAAEETEVTE